MKIGRGSYHVSDLLSGFQIGRSIHGVRISGRGE